MKNHLHNALAVAFVGFMIMFNVWTAIADDIDKAPPWYTGKKPWASISKEGREEILGIRRKYDATKSKANEKSNQIVPATTAKKGELLVQKTHKQYGIHSYYRNPSMFGARTVIWIPEKAWSKFTQDQKSSIEVFMKSKYANWGIGVGRVSGVDILADRLVVEH